MEKKLAIKYLTPFQLTSHWGPYVVWRRTVSGPWCQSVLLHCYGRNYAFSSSTATQLHRSALLICVDYNRFVGTQAHVFLCSFSCPNVRNALMFMNFPFHIRIFYLHSIPLVNYWWNGILRWERWENDCFITGRWSDVAAICLPMVSLFSPFLLKN